MGTCGSTPPCWGGVEGAGSCLEEAHQKGSPTPVMAVASKGIQGLTLVQQLRFLRTRRRAVGGARVCDAAQGLTELAAACGLVGKAACPGGGR